MLPKLTIARKCVSELCGTFAVTFFHAGIAASTANTAVMNSLPTQQTNITAVGLVSGLSLAGIVYAFGHISAHVNPAVSLAVTLRGDMYPLMLIPYFISQVAGAFLAAGILAAVFINDSAHGNLGANAPTGGFSVGTGFLMEFFGSAFLIFGILGTATRGKGFDGHSAIAAGFAVGAGIGFLAPYGGGSFNPARSLAPGMLATEPGVRGVTWVYVVSPLAAAVRCSRDGIPDAEEARGDCRRTRKRNQRPRETEQGG
jgi:glycerol uptake facilitator-like aquaporin